jgi:hypothetical protein
VVDNWFWVCAWGSKLEEGGNTLINQSNDEEARNYEVEPRMTAFDG